MIYRDATVNLEYGTARGVYASQTPPLAFQSGVPRAIELTGLTPNTRYFYRLRIRATETATEPT